RYGVPDRVELINPQRVDWPTSIESAVNASTTSLEIHNKYAIPIGTVVQIDAEKIFIPSRGERNSCASDPVATNWNGCATMTGVHRGYQGTTPAAHAANAVVTSLDDQQH